MKFDYCTSVGLSGGCGYQCEKFQDGECEVYEDIILNEIDSGESYDEDIDYIIEKYT